MSQPAVQIQTPGGRVVIGTGSAAVNVPGPPRLVIVGAAQGIAGAAGISAYASYVATTADDPVLTEAQWAAVATVLEDDSVTLAKMASGTAGNLITYDASGNPAAVATGTAGQVLTSGGAGVAPTFQAAVGAEVTISDTAPLSPEAGALWLRTTDYRQFTWTGTEWVESSAGYVSEIGSTFETVSKNLNAYPATLAYSSGNLSSITYALGGGLTIVKTFNYTGTDLTSIVLSGYTPGGISLTKTLTYSSGNLVGISYS